MQPDDKLNIDSLTLDNVIGDGVETVEDVQDVVEEVVEKIVQGVHRRRRGREQVQDLAEEQQEEDLRRPAPVQDGDESREEVSAYERDGRRSKRSRERGRRGQPGLGQRDRGSRKEREVDGLNAVTEGRCEEAGGAAEAVNQAHVRGSR